ncbi:MAG: PEGA domain protein [Candidatus Curtissbacteria bacterium GW2011_GWB1_40_28]|nr:MAG: PEGA domain protein [Candidatus Curtissbacteria bacterium GW2011_GWB1_40_28]
MLAKYRVLFSILIVVFVLTLAAVVIFWARGFKPNFKNGTIERTGLIVASSTPTGAQVYLDDRLTSATDTNIAFLEPKTYKVRIQKDGYTTWEKEIEVRADLATEIKALLFPLAPAIKPLTTTGAASPTLSPNGTKIIFGVSGERGGLYSLSMTERNLPFRQELRLLAKNQSAFDFSGSNFVWSPDSRQVVARFVSEEGQSSANLLVDTDKSEQELRDITASLTATFQSWQEQISTLAQTQAMIAPDEVKSATAEAEPNSSQLTVDGSQKKQSVNNEPITTNQLNYFPTGLMFSPDEEKILYKNKEGIYKVYDLKAKKEYTLPDFDNLVNLSWYPDSSHLVIAQKDLISIIEADGTNKMTVFSGKFENGFVFAHPTKIRFGIYNLH